MPAFSLPYCSGDNHSPHPTATLKERLREASSTGSANWPLLQEAEARVQELEEALDFESMVNTLAWLLGQNDRSAWSFGKDLPERWEQMRKTPTVAEVACLLRAAELLAGEDPSKLTAALMQAKEEAESGHDHVSTLPKGITP